MTITHLIAFNITLLAALASPGPAFLVAVRTALNTNMFTGIALGMGLGLAISAQIINEMGGTLDAETADTGGAVFRICLPKVQ